MSIESETFSPIHPKLQEALSHIELPKFPFAPPIMRDFLIASNFELPPSDGNSFDKWFIQKVVVSTYYSADTTFDEISKPLGKSRERIRQIFYEAIPNIHRHSSLEVRLQFPESSLRPHMIKHQDDAPLVYRYLIRKNLGSRILGEADLGKSFNEIAASISLSHHMLRRRILLLRSLGIDVPRIPRSSVENAGVLEALIKSKDIRDQEKADERLRELYKSVNMTIYFNGIGDGTFISLTALARGLNFFASRKNLSKFIRALEKASIPFCLVKEDVPSGEQAGLKQYFMVVAWHRDRIETAWNENPDTSALKTNPVTQVCGQSLGKDQVPTTWQIKQKWIQKDNKESLVLSVHDVLLEDFGLESTSKKARMIRKNLGKDNYTGNIFSYAGVFYLWADDREILKRHIETMLTHA